MSSRTRRMVLLAQEGQVEQSGASTSNRSRPKVIVQRIEPLPITQLNGSSDDSFVEENVMNYDNSNEDHITMNTVSDNDFEVAFSNLDDDSVVDKNYVPSLSDLNEDSNSSSSTLSSDNIPLARVDKFEIKVFIKFLLKTIIDTATQKISDQDAAKSYTKKGSIRKRKLYDDSPLQRKQKKIQQIIGEHKVKESCGDNTCRRQCSKKISKDRQIDINEQFWALSPSDQRNFMLHNSKTANIKRHTTENSRRSQTFYYSLECELGNSHSVCKSFFLGTLGYDRKNDKVLRNVLARKHTGKIVAAVDGRGKGPASNRIDENIINTHIESFNPCISHYRREHAPQRRYLPSDISITSMYNHFKSVNPQLTISYEVYRKCVNNKNISFVKLGHEECWSCERFTLHGETTSHNKERLNDDCSSCQQWKLHYDNYIQVREEYKRDGDSEDIVYSADLQKVIMLPRCDMYKEIIFTPRIISFNESFVPVGKKRVKPFAFIWHEAVSGRKKEDIISTFYHFLLQVRDERKIVIWLDNCSAQNKNWTLLSFFIYMINSSEIDLNTLEVKFFEPGHTFMSADSFHHQVEMQLKRKRKVYDFSDFLECVENANKKGHVKEMKVTDFKNWVDFSSQYKLARIVPRPLLQNMMHMIFKRGARSMAYKNSFADASFVDLNFLTAKWAKQPSLPKPQTRVQARGVTAERKRGLLDKLAAILPQNRLAFWKDLPVNNEVGREEEEDE